MPELPEVETVARGLRASLVGRTITGMEVRWVPTLVPPDPATFARRLVGQMISGVGRRGKWIIIALDDGDTLLVHLRMTGQLVLEPADSPDDRHMRAVGRQFANFRGRLVTVHHRHLAVHQDQIVGRCIQHFHSHTAVFSHISAIACALQNLQCDFLIDQIVLDEQDADVAAPGLAQGMLSEQSLVLFNGGDLLVAD